MIRLYLATYTFSSALPNAFNIEQVQDSVRVTISLKGQVIYSTTLFEDGNGKATFYGLREIIEQNMLGKYLAIAELSITADHSDGGEEYEGKYIVYSRYNNANDSCQDFLLNHFLTNRPYCTIPRDLYASVPFIADENEQLSAYYDCIFEKDGTTYYYRLDTRIYSTNTASLHYIHIAPPSVKYASNQAEGDDCGTLRSFTLHVGSRSMMVFVSDETPDIILSFRNCYNATETAFIQGTTTLKTDIDRKEALSQGITSFYDQTVERKHEVQTAPLTLEEARWLNELLESHDVTMELNQDHDRETVLISDITSEISDSSKDTVHLKFSWRFADGNIWLNEDHYPQQFTSPFNDVFK